MGVGRWFFKCQRYLISLFSKNVNKRWVGGQRFPKNGQRSLRMTPYRMTQGGRASTFERCWYQNYLGK